MVKSKKGKYDDLIESAFSYQKKDDWKGRVERYRGYYKGHYYEEESSHEQYVVNSVHSYTDLFGPNLIINDPYIKVSPKTKYIFKGDKAIPTGRISEIVESVLNKELKSIGFEHEIRKVIQDTLIYGFGVLKFGYAFSSLDKDDGMEVKEDTAWCSRVWPKDFGIDPASVGNINLYANDARYVVHRLVMPLNYVKSSELYKNVEELSTDIPEDHKKRMSNDGNEEKMSEDFGTFYEIHDMEKGKIITVSKGKQKPHREIDNPLNVNCHFAIFRLSWDNDEFAGIPLVEMMEDQARILNKTTTKMVNHLDIFPGQVLAEEGALTESQKDQMEDGQQGSIIETNNGALRDGRVIKQPPVPMGSDYFNVLGVAQQQIDFELGVQDFRTPGGSSRRTAAEVTMQQADANVRREYYTKLVKSFVLDGATKVLKIIQQNYDRKRFVKIEGDNTVDYVEWDKESIEGDWDLDLDVESMRFLSQGTVQQIINLLNVLGAHSKTIPAFATALSALDGEKLVKMMFKSMGLNFDSLKKNQIIGVQFDPTVENALFAAGKMVPDPRLNEPHADHKKHHIDAYVETQNPELLRHIKMHDFYEKIQSGQISPQQLQELGTVPAAQAQSLGSPGGFQPNASPAPTDIEIMGGFNGNQNVRGAL